MNVEKNLVKRTFYRFLWPAMLSALTLALLPMTDMLVAGHLFGDMGLTAITIALPVVFTVTLIQVLLSMGGVIVFSNCLGKGEFHTCSQVFTFAVVGACVLGSLLSILGLLLLRPLTVFLGAVGSQVEPAMAYIRVILLGLPFLILAPILNNFLINDSRQNFSMFCVVFCAVLNVVLSILSATVLGMGIAGIAVGTIVSQLVSCILAGTVLYRKKRNYGFTKDFFQPKLIGKLLGISSSVALMLLWQIVFAVSVNHILSSSDGVAVYGVIKTFINFMFVGIFDGVSAAMQPMLSIYYGEREGRNLCYTARYSFHTFMLMALLIFAVMQIFAPAFCTLFGMESPALRALAIRAFHLVGLYAFGAAMCVFIEGYFRCIGREQVSIFIVLVDSVAMQLLGLIVYVFILGLNNIGVFMAIALSTIGTTIAFILYYKPFGRGTAPDGKPTWLKGFWAFTQDLREEDENQFQRIVPVSADRIQELTRDAEEYCRAKGFSDKKRFYIGLCIEELIVKAVGIMESRHQNSSGLFADVKIIPRENGEVRLRIRDNMTEWTPKALDFSAPEAVEQIEDPEGVNTLGFGIIQKIAKDFSYKRTIGLNNFSVTL